VVLVVLANLALVGHAVGIDFVFPGLSAGDGGGGDFLGMHGALLKGAIAGDSI
jgi:hypothetical protein